MRIHVKLSTTLRDLVPGYEPEQGLFLESCEGSLVADIARQAGLPPELIKIIMVNGRQKKLDDPDMLRDGDRVAFFPAVGGG